MSAVKPTTLPDPLADPAFRAPGLWQSLREGLLGGQRPVACAQIEVTSICPGRCTYCPHTTDASRWKSRHMEAATMARLWPLLRQTGRAHLQGWGEPLLHPRFLDFAAFARKAGCRISTTTCGLVMNDELAVSLVDSGLDVIAFSLAGTSEASNASREGVPFSRVLAAINQLQTVRKARMGVHLEVHLAYLMLASNMEAVRHLPELMADLDVHAAIISTLDYISTPELAAEAFNPTTPAGAEQLEAARALLTEAQTRARAAGRELHFALPAASVQHGDCREAVTRTLYVDAEGQLSPCIYVNLPVTDLADTPNPLRRVFGSALTADPFATWQGPDFTAFRQALLAGTPDTPCQTCVKRMER